MARRLSDLSRLLMNRREPDGRFYAAHIDGRWRVDRPRGGRTALFHRTDCLTLRDVIQNHLFRVLANLAMEPPARIDSESMREEKRKVLKSITPIDPEDLGRGQFRGYRDEPGVTPDSQVETFAALRLRIESWRWRGVPFYIREGTDGGHAPEPTGHRRYVVPRRTRPPRPALEGPGRPCR